VLVAVVVIVVEVVVVVVAAAAPGASESAISIIIISRFISRLQAGQWLNAGSASGVPSSEREEDLVSSMCCPSDIFTGVVEAMGAVAEGEEEDSEEEDSEEEGGGGGGGGGGGRGGGGGGSLFSRIRL
jgi:uncharacterized membrane protein YgcG